MKKMKQLLVAAGILAAAMSALAVQQQNEVSGQATSDLRVERESRRSNTLTAPINVNLKLVGINGQPAILGAYVARVEFNPSEVEVRLVKGGASKAFSGDPIFTELSKANKDGLLKLTAWNTSDDSASGDVSVAKVIFRELRDGGAETIRISIDSVSSTVVKDAGGEAKQYAITVAAAE